MGQIQDQQSGFDFPMIAKGIRGRVAYAKSDTVALVKASMRQIVLTAPGERMWNPEFGCKLRLFQFESITETVKATIISMVMEAIRRWETRVIIDSIDVIASTDIDTSVEIRVNFTIKNPDFASLPDVILISI